VPGREHQRRHAVVIRKVGSGAVPEQHPNRRLVAPISAGGLVHGSLAVPFTEVWIYTRLDQGIDDPLASCVDSLIAVLTLPADSVQRRGGARGRDGGHVDRQEELDGIGGVTERGIGQARVRPLFQMVRVQAGLDQQPRDVEPLGPAGSGAAAAPQDRAQRVVAVAVLGLQVQPSR
jgi:hypothetical protein